MVDHNPTPKKSSNWVELCGIVWLPAEKWPPLVGKTTLGARILPINWYHFKWQTRLAEHREGGFGCICWEGDDYNDRAGWDGKRWEWWLVEQGAGGKATREWFIIDFHPRDDDEHTAGHIDGEKVIRELSLEGQIDRQTAVLPCIKMNLTKSYHSKLSHWSPLMSDQKPLGWQINY